ncbi:MAG TPA: hypothetical protein VE861_14320 [Gemmatimonadaceae bacterium]|nr:hypothetical protein [Gemmatimonadaceae bacterium]
MAPSRAAVRWQSLRAAAIMLVTLAVVPAAVAQRAPAVQPAMRIRPTLRLDAVADRDPGAQVAGGLALRAAYNVRLAVDAGAGTVQRGDTWRGSGRVDLLVRWLADPFRESRWGLSGGGGVGMQFEQARAPRPVAIVTVGIEGRGDGTWVPGVELGLGGGARVGFTLRRAPRGQR